MHQASGHIVTWMDPYNHPLLSSYYIIHPKLVLVTESSLYTKHIIPTSFHSKLITFAYILTSKHQLVTPKPSNLAYYWLIYFPYHYVNIIMHDLIRKFCIIAPDVHLITSEKQNF